MKEIEDLKEDIISRYNMSWEDAHIQDNTGIIQAAKDNFRNLLELLIQKTLKEGMNIKN